MKKLKVALVGLGVVGKSVYEILVNQKNILDNKSKNEFELVAVSNRSKKDFIDQTKVKFIENPLDLANDKEIDVIIETAGNAANIVKLWQEALKNGKKIITANKALFASHGLEMSDLAQENAGYIAFEASCAAAIPIVKILKESFTGNEIESFCGILNGTANYILTKMADENIDFDVALKKAQDAGYAEADPAFDIEGIDAAHKLAILAAIASGTRPKFDEIYVQGVSKISKNDIKLADELGYKIKLLGIYDKAKNQQTVYPALIEKSARIASVDDSFNAIITKGSNCAESFVMGRGAGGKETASAIIGDLVDIANDRFSYEFGKKNQDLGDFNLAKIENRIGKYFVPLTMENKSDLDKELLKKLKVEKSHFYQNIEKSSFYKGRDDKVFCGLITGEICEKELIDLKIENFIRVEEF